MAPAKRNIDDILRKVLTSPSSEEIDEAGARILERIKSEFPEETAAFRFWPHSQDTLRKLKPEDELVLAALRLLGGSGEYRAIRQKVEAVTSRELHFTAVLFSLTRLEDMQLVSVRLPQPSSADSKPMRIFTLTGDGECVLRAIRAAALAAGHSLSAQEDFA